jgi:hypothetical protein
MNVSSETNYCKHLQALTVMVFRSAL